MMKKSLIRVASIGAVAALFATMAPQLAHAATEPAWDTASAGKVYLMNNNTAEQIAKGTQLDWNPADGVVLTANPVPADLGDLSWAPFPASSGATEKDTIAFLAPVGSEKTPSAWKAWGDPSALDTAPLLPNVAPGVLLGGTPGAVKASGGTFSMGIAYTDSAIVASTHVSKAYYVTVNIDAGTGAWKFSTPPGDVVIVNTDVATTTTLAANPSSVDVGSTTVLTATVSASKAVTGNVEFYAGATKIATQALAAGSATKSATVANTGNNTFSAKFVENVVVTSPTTTDTFKASTSADVIVVGNTPVAPPVPKAPTENSLNSSTANGATAAYTVADHKATLTVNASNTGKTVDVFVYSTPIYLGTVTIAGTTVSFDVSVLPAGDHKIVIVDPTTHDVLAWGLFTKSDAASQPTFSKTINADVANGSGTPADGEFSLTNLSSSTVNLVNPALVNGKSVVSGQLGDFKVTDMRVVTKAGWTLKTDVAQFVKGTDTIANSALGIAPTVVSQTAGTAPVLGAAQVSGSATYPWNFATLAAGSYSGVSTYNADLVFTAPAASPAGTYTSTLTLTLISN